MYALYRLLSARDLVLEQLPALVAALALAEAFYKFGSFLLEAVAFLATWVVLEFGIRHVRRALIGHTPVDSDTAG